MKSGLKSPKILNAEHKAFAYDMLPFQHAIRDARNSVEEAKKHLEQMEKEFKLAITQKYPDAVFTNFVCLNRLNLYHIYEHNGGKCIFCGCDNFDD